MRRRDVLRAAAGIASTAVAGHAAAHPGPYEPFGFARLDGTKEAVVGDDGTTVYTALTDGFGVVDVSDRANPTVLVERRDLFADHEGGPLEAIYDVKVDGDTLLVVGPAHGLGEGTHLQGAAVYDVADPANPSLRGFFETDFPIHNADVQDGVAYLTANTGTSTAMVLVDVTGSDPTELGRWQITDENEAWADVNPFVRSIHDIYVHGDVAYVAHWDAGTWFVDVSDPANPRAVGHVAHYEPSELTDVNPRTSGYQLPGNSHYAAVNDDGSVLAVGEEAWDLDVSDDRNGGPGGITLYDVRDPGDVSRLSRISPPPTPDPGIGGVWTTSHNFDFRGDRLYTSWYRGGVKLFDVADPAEPLELAWWRKPSEASFWTAQAAAACYVGASRKNPEMETEGGEPGVGAGVYTFPDHPGTQADPPSLTPTTTTRARPTTTTATTTTTTTTMTTTTTSVDTPGFGVLAGLAALGAAGSAWLRRDDGP